MLSTTNALGRLNAPCATPFLPTLGHREMQPPVIWVPASQTPRFDDLQARCQDPRAGTFDLMGPSGTTFALTTCPLHEAPPILELLAAHCDVSANRSPSLRPRMDSRWIDLHWVSSNALPQAAFAGPTESRDANLIGCVAGQLDRWHALQAQKLAAADTLAEAQDNVVGRSTVMSRIFAYAPKKPQVFFASGAAAALSAAYVLIEYIRSRQFGANALTNSASRCASPSVAPTLSTIAELPEDEGKKTPEESAVKSDMSALAIKVESRESTPGKEVPYVAAPSTLKSEYFISDSSRASSEAPHDPDHDSTSVSSSCTHGRGGSISVGGFLIDEEDSMSAHTQSDSDSQSASESFDEVAVEGLMSRSTDLEKNVLRANLSSLLSPQEERERELKMQLLERRSGWFGSGAQRKRR